MSRAWLEQLGASLRPCLESVSASLTPLGQQLSGLNLRQYLPTAWPGLRAAQEVGVNGQRFAVVRLLGEGGYSFVFLVRELPTPQQPLVSGRQYALKKVLIGGDEQLRAAEREIEVMRKLRHPNLMPLLDASIEEEATPDGPRRVAHMLFPLYDAGSLWDLVTAHTAQGNPLPLREVLLIFIQVCAALQSMHEMEPAYAHRDVKPQNVLLRRQRPQQPGGSGSSSYAAAPSWQPQQQAVLRPPGGGGGGSGGGSLGKKNNGGGGSSSGTGPRYAPLPSAGVSAVEEEFEFDGLELQPVGSGGLGRVAGEDGAQQGQQGQQGQGQQQGEYHAVLMDFGSTKPASVEVFNRTEAMAVQEDAAAHCTAPYRAPELWDVPSSCSLDERMDVWSMGCLLYFMLVGESPFERVLGEAGGSLMLAVVNGRVSWPPALQGRCPQELRELVMLCLNTDPLSRPFIAEVKQRAEQALAALPS